MPVVRGLQNVRRRAKARKELRPGGLKTTALEQLTEQQVQELRSSFKSFDKDKTGFLCAATPPWLVAHDEMPARAARYSHLSV